MPARNTAGISRASILKTDTREIGTASPWLLMTRGGCGLLQKCARPVPSTPLALDDGRCNYLVVGNLFDRKKKKKKKKKKTKRKRFSLDSISTNKFGEINISIVTRSQRSHLSLSLLANQFIRPFHSTKEAIPPSSPSDFIGIPKYNFSPVALSWPFPDLMKLERLVARRHPAGELYRVMKCDW